MRKEILTSVSVLTVIGLLFVVLYLLGIVGKKEDYTNSDMEIGTQLQMETKMKEDGSSETVMKMSEAGSVPASTLSMTQEDKQVAQFKMSGIQGPTELLPQETAADQWATQLDTGLTPEYRSFIEAGQHVGTDGRAGGMKNPNLQVRSDPPIPREAVGPWNNSSYQPNPYQREFEVGSAGM